MPEEKFKEKAIISRLNELKKQFDNNTMLENSIEERRIIGELERALNNEEFVDVLEKAGLIYKRFLYC